VVWWDPRTLGLDKRHDVGLRQERLLAADEAGAASTAGIEAHARWQEARSEGLARGARPSMAVESVTVSAQGAEGAPVAAVAREQSSAARQGRPHGRRFGTLVHAVLATVPLDASPVRVAMHASQQARWVGAPAEEIAAATEAVVAALDHPLLRRASLAPLCRREAPLVIPLGDGTLLEGIVDLAFREVAEGAGRWTVVDFKTDVELDGRLEGYERQVAAYAQAIATATGEPADAVLLSV
jgi:ATP-dependent exoDNAse (exonuclease V) beta subunit